MRLISLIIIILFSLSLSSQRGLYMGGQVGYGFNEGPLEKYKGIQLGTFFQYEISNFVLQCRYDHITGTPNYGTTYSKDLPNVAVYDIYDQNYPLVIYPTDDFSEVKVGVHQFDPSFGKYVARQYSFGTGYKIPFKVKKLNFSISPMIFGFYRHVNENFIYGVKEIKIEDSFQSNNFLPVNHLIFAYLRYANLGYMINFPIEISLNKTTSISTSLSVGKTFKGYSQTSIGLGIISKI